MQVATGTSERRCNSCNSISNWRLYTTDRRGRSKVIQLHPLPDSKTFDEEPYNRCKLSGWLQMHPILDPEDIERKSVACMSENSSASKMKLVELNNLVCVTFDPRPQFRGYWVATAKDISSVNMDSFASNLRHGCGNENLVLYRLQQPCSQQRCMVGNKSQAELHMKHRLALVVMSCFYDLFFSRGDGHTFVRKTVNVIVNDSRMKQMFHHESVGDHDCGSSKGKSSDSSNAATVQHETIGNNSASTGSVCGSKIDLELIAHCKRIICMYFTRIILVVTENCIFMNSIQKLQSENKEWSDQIYGTVLKLETRFRLGPWGETKIADNSCAIFSGSTFGDRPKKILGRKLIDDNKLSVAIHNTDDTENEEPEIADNTEMKRQVKRKSLTLESPISSPLRRQKLVTESPVNKRKQLYNSLRDTEDDPCKKPNFQDTFKIESSKLLKSQIYTTPKATMPAYKLVALTKSKNLFLNPYLYSPVKMGLAMVSFRLVGIRCICSISKRIIFLQSNFRKCLFPNPEGSDDLRDWSRVQTKNFCLSENQQDAEEMFSKVGDWDVVEGVELESVLIVIEALKNSCRNRKSFVNLFLFKSMGGMKHNRASFVIFHDFVCRSLKMLEEVKKQGVLKIEMTTAYLVLLSMMQFIANCDSIDNMKKLEQLKKVGVDWEDVLVKVCLVMFRLAQTLCN